jgi:hypothetical protein
MRCKDFREGSISVRFKGVAGRIDQGAGILFNVQPNGDYLALRANPLEDNLVLWQVREGPALVGGMGAQHADTHGPVARAEAQGRCGKQGRRLDQRQAPTCNTTCRKPVSGRVGLWSKADSVVYFDDYRVQ